jgi:Spy/CpxP family protein refolding chaperone
MRTLGSMVVALSAAVLLTGPAKAQFFPRGGQGGPTSLLNLLQQQDVQKELGIDKEDLDKLPDAVMDALGKVLKPEQLKRLQQLDLQRRGNQAFNDAKVQKKLNFTDEQKKQVETIVSDYTKELRDLFGGGRRGGGGGARGNREEAQKKMTELSESTTKKINEVLTPEQKKKWKNMIGQPFKFERGGRGGRPRQDR